MTEVNEASATESRTDRPDDEQAVRQTVTREFRPRRTVPAVIVAVLLAAAAVLVAIEILAELFGNPLGLLPVEDLARLGRETQWNDPLTFIVAILACLLGLLLLFLALWPGRVKASALSSGRPGVAVAITSSDLQRLATQAAESVSGVDRASASGGAGKLDVRADSPLHDAGDLGDQVQRAVSEQLDQLALLRPPRIRVNVRHRED